MILTPIVVNDVKLIYLFKKICYSLLDEEGNRSQ
jgi:hypothetical protein